MSRPVSRPERGPATDSLDPELDALFYELLARDGHVAPDDPAWAPLRARHGDPAVDDYLGTMALLHPDTGSPAAGHRPRPAHLDLRAFGGHYAVPDDHYIDQGGLNSVHRVIDTRFGRVLAAKVPLVPYLADEEIGKHLRREAHLCARLQHPCIVPIYEEGRYVVEGREVCPYFTMKLVEGHTLRAILDDRPDPADDLPELLGVLIQVSGAIAYAHEKGVIHLDVKPGNIMVGAHGEVHVMDWGFARDRDEGERAIPARLLTIHRASLILGGDSRYGTAAYMAPEQGTIPARPTEKTDVFALGGLLLHVLTGQPVYVGDDARSTWTMAAEGRTEAALARLAAAPADGSLKALAGACLDRDPARRPTAHAFHAALRDFLARLQDEKVQAERERTEAERRTARAERRAKRLTIGLAALVVAVVVSCTGAWIWKQAEARRIEEARRVATLSAEAARLVGEAYAAIERGAYARAEAALREAKGQLGDRPPAAVKDRVDRLAADLDLATDLDAIRQERAVLSADPEYSNLPALEQYRARFQSIGVDPSGDQDRAARLVAESPIRRTLVAALDDWAASEVDATAQDALFRTLRRVDPDPQWGDRVRDRAFLGDPAAVVALVDRTSLDRLSMRQIETLIEVLPPESPSLTRLLDAAETREPGNFWVHYSAARRLLHARADDHEARERLRRRGATHARIASALRPESLGALFVLFDPDTTSAELEAIASRVDRLGRNPSYREAILAMADERRGAYTSAVDHWKAAVALRPGEPSLHVYLANALMMVGEVEASAGHLAEVLRTRPRFFIARQLQANILALQGRAAEARSIAADLLAERPTDAESRVLLATCLMLEGRLLDAHRLTRGLAPDALDQPHVRMALGLLAYASGDEATRALVERASSYPDPFFHMLRCILDADAGRYAHALDELDALSRAIQSRQVSSAIFRGITPLKLLARRVNLRNFANWDALLGARIPDPDLSRLTPITRLVAPSVGEFFLGKKFYGAAVRVYGTQDVSSVTMSFRVAPGFGSGRMCAARAGAQAWAGKGHDAFQAKDADRARALNLAVEALEAEVRTCHNYAERDEGLSGAAWALLDGGTRSEARLRLGQMLLHPDFEPLRSDQYHAAMPPETVRRLAAAWTEIRSLYDRLCPPIGLPPS